MPLQQGSIVWVNLGDPNGRNPKTRPAVVVTPTSEIAPDTTIIVVAATGTFTKPLPANQVALPWKAGGHPVTSLYKPCVAVCDWLLQIDQATIDSIGGVCPPYVLTEILDRLPAS